jgi:hypothetical protein
MDIKRSTFYYQKKVNIPQGEDPTDHLPAPLLWLPENHRTIA